jgi:hypothetical protein
MSTEAGKSPAAQRNELASFLMDAAPVFALVASDATFLAGALLSAGYRRVSADPETVEAVANAIEAEYARYCHFSAAFHSKKDNIARAAIAAIRGDES